MIKDSYTFRDENGCLFFLFKIYKGIQINNSIDQKEKFKYITI